MGGRAGEKFLRNGREGEGVEESGQEKEVETEEGERRAPVLCALPCLLTPLLPLSPISPLCNFLHTLLASCQGLLSVLLAWLIPFYF